MDAFHNIDNPLIQKPCMEPNKCSEVQLSNTDEKIKENWLTKRVLKRQVGKRRKSIGIGRPKSMDFVVLRLSKSSIPLQQKKRLDDDYQWDPHIDILDILREKLNGITRLTQEIHIQELFQSRLLVKKKDMSHLVKCNLRRLYSAEGEDSNEQQFISTGHTPTYSYGCLVANETVWNNAMSDHENEGQEIKTNQNLTSLFMITNNLLHSKLDEIFEATSVNKESGDLEWRNQFLSLMNICIEQSEKLESLSVDILNAEQQVRELLFLNHSLDEQFCKQEKYYEERIREYQEAANQQKLMMDSLDELAADININIESTVEEYKKVSQDDIGEVKGMINNKEKVKRWDFSKAVSNLLHMEEKHDIVHKMRWDVGMLVEGDIDIGHNLCSFETPLNGIDRMIASSGAITEPVKKIHLNDDQEKGKGEKSSFISRTIRRIKFYQCSYALHLTHKDKQDRFALLSKTLWTPDEQASLCQFFSCKTQFSFLVRRHHCRRCGQVICHKHSMNKLPLFSSSNQFEWSRVCDVCFQDLIITQTK